MAPRSGLRRELLARKGFAGWAPSDKLGETNCKQHDGLVETTQGEKTSARTLSQAAHGVRVPTSAGWGSLGARSRVGRPRKTRCLQHQQDIALHTSTPGPSQPHWPLSTLTKPSGTLLILRPLKNGSAGEAECVLGTTPERYSSKACSLWVRDGSHMPTLILSSICNIWIDSS